jgi:hypothetical protein
MERDLGPPHPDDLSYYPSVLPVQENDMRFNRL